MSEKVRLLARRSRMSCVTGMPLSMILVDSLTFVGETAYAAPQSTTTEASSHGLMPSSWRKIECDYIAQPYFASSSMHTVSRKKIDYEWSLSAAYGR